MPPRVVLYSTGGTIASVGGPASQAVPRLSAQELIAAVPGLGEVAELEAVTLRQVASPELELSDLVELARRSGEAVEGGASGVVVTQGTDTMEESAFVLDLLWDREAPLVVTGAMRTPDQAGADGPANLLAAVRVAASAAARGLGCVVVMNDQIHAARFVRKAHTTNPGAFSSPACGPLGWVAEGRVRVLVRPPRLQPLRLDRVPEEVPVALVRAALGDDGRLLRALPGLGYRGVVVEATGGGHLPRSWVPLLEELGWTMPVALASRTGAGELLRRTYGFPGSETDLLARGLVPAGALDGLKARLLLMLVLAAGGGREEVERAFRLMDPAGPEA
ncbi:MAG TPA: asparaginase [Candidatus Dormibacteraeota bacterium]|nr:asparaginase [Candidatus Dormibacteraeota bacterium]